MNIKIVKEKISKQELEELAQEFYIDMVKGVVDIEKGIIALGGEWHMDANQVLIANASHEQNRWRFNIYMYGRTEHISITKITPSQNKRTLAGEDAVRREKINVIS